MTTVARHLTIHGRVQGVFYRGWAVETARELRLVGWIRNRHNGTVEAIVQGGEPAVERFIALAHEGPAGAEVERVEVREVGPSGELEVFKQERTV
ncbi:acylphosphatase [Altererythrobacter soli]|uniref:acylphosphatase n=1 Tax=Croceibacterium soli TaxID=1739690 RepID=A0A6I4UTS2_9SPHN|nr:acylphosphatase [Croceibacterium soli]MXP41184.1 acylphosphatase [Croceibacterium soli]